MDRIYSYDEKSVTFFQIDEHARQATANDEKSFDLLVSYLKMGVSNDLKDHAQLILARGLLVWMGQALPSFDGGSGRPKDLIASMLNKLTSRADVYAKLCRRAGIKCEVIKGRSKAIPYKVGDNDSEAFQGFFWNMITADGQEHLVHPEWSTNSIDGFSYGGEMLMESDGEFKGQMQCGSEGLSTAIFNEFWFCTHPKLFIVQCFPDQKEHQLLPDNNVVRNVEGFFDLPFLGDGLFLSRLSLITEQSCRLKSKKGKCQINILADKTNINDLNLSYRLSLISPTDVKLNAKDMPLLVLFSKSKDVLEFEIRFPVVGDYRFEIDVLHTDSQIQRTCCEFRINCTEVNTGCRKLPIESGIEGYGFSSTAENVGLKNPSVSTGKIYTKVSTSDIDSSKTNLKFQIEEKMVDDNEFGSDVYSVDSAGNVVTHKGYSEVVVHPKLCKVCVQLNITQHGEYAVVLNAKAKGSKKKDTRRIAQYFVSTDPAFPEEQRQMKFRKRATKIDNKVENKKAEKKALHWKFSNLLKEIKLDKLSEKDVDK